MRVHAHIRAQGACAQCCIANDKAILEKKQLFLCWGIVRNSTAGELQFYSDTPCRCKYIGYYVSVPNPNMQNAKVPNVTMPNLIMSMCHSAECNNVTKYNVPKG
jgi:hypothetical protein